MPIMPIGYQKPSKRQTDRTTRYPPSLARILRISTIQELQKLKDSNIVHFFYQL